MYYDNEIMNITKRELHALIADAVREGVLAAMKESGKKTFYPDSERPREINGVTEPLLKTPTSDGGTENAKSYLPSLRRTLDVTVLLGRYGSLAAIKELKSLCDEDEIKYILTHLESDYTPKNSLAWRDNIKSLKTVWVERDF
jgi:hypothetical protein